MIPCLCPGTLLLALSRMEVVEELALTAADRAAGVTWQGEPPPGDRVVSPSAPTGPEATQRGGG